MREGRGKRERGEGVEDRKEETREGIEEQRAPYTWAKRREGAFPNRAELNRKRQRTGIETTDLIIEDSSTEPFLCTI